MSDSAVPDREQIREDFRAWSSQNKTAGRREFITGFLCWFLIPFAATISGFVLLLSSSGKRNTSIGIWLLLILFVIALSVTFGILRYRKISGEGAPLRERVGKYYNSLQERLLSEAFGTEVSVRERAVLNPADFEDGITSHIFGMGDCRDWNYRLSYCSAFSYRNGEIRLCSVDANDNTVNDADNHRIEVRGLYLAVHTRRSFDFSHDPLHVEKRRREDPEQADRFARLYKGKRKAGRPGQKTEADSVKEMPEETAQAIMNFGAPAYGYYVEEAWVTRDGVFYFLIHGVHQSVMVNGDYDRTEEFYRTVYAQLSELAGACCG